MYNTHLMNVKCKQKVSELILCCNNVEKYFNNYKLRVVPVHFTRLKIFTISLVITKEIDNASKHIKITYIS